MLSHSNIPIVDDLYVSKLETNYFLGHPISYKAKNFHMKPEPVTHMHQRHASLAGIFMTRLCKR